MRAFCAGSLYRPSKRPGLLLLTFGNPHLSFSGKTPIHGYPLDRPMSPPPIALGGPGGRPFGGPGHGFGGSHGQIQHSAPGFAPPHPVHEPTPQAKAHLAAYAAGIGTDQVLTYCTGCRGGIMQTGKQPVDFVNLVMGVM